MKILMMISHFKLRLFEFMQIKRLIFLGLLPVLLVGCAGQAPAPIYGGGVVVPSQAKTAPKVKKAKKPKVVKSVPAPVEPEIVEVKPLTDPSAYATRVEEMQPELIMPEQQFQQDSSALGTPSNGLVTEHTQAPSVPTTGSSAENLKAEAPAAPISAPVVVQPPGFEPLETFAPLSPAVTQLASAANQSTKAGNIEAATTTLERAIRIEPRNATLYYKLALLKLKQSKPRLAEDLAKKAALLASNDANMKKHSWLLIARARELQGDTNGSQEAKAKSDSF